MVTFLTWTIGVLIVVAGYALWRRRRSGRREQFRHRLTVLFLAFGLLPAILTVFFLTNAMNELLGALRAPGVEAAIRGAIHALQSSEREAERKLVELLRRGDVRGCLQDSTVIWLAQVDPNGRPVRVLGDTADARLHLAWANWDREVFATAEAAGESEILRYVRVRGSDGRQWVLCRRYPEGVARTLLDLRRSLRAYGTLALLREGMVEQEVFWALAASLVAVLALLAVVAARVTARRVAQPISQLAAAMERVSQGDLDVAVPEVGDEEIAQLARSFNRMIAELRDSRQRLARTERLAAWRDVARQVSHEIRNALTPAQLTLHRLRRRLTDSPQGEAAENLLRSVEGQLTVLSRLAEAFSQLGRLPEPAFQSTDLNELVSEVVALFEAEVHGLRFILERDQQLPPVSVDRDRIRQVLNNLLRNAVEASRPRSSIWIRTGRASENGFSARIEIQDEGSGMSDEALASAFKPYFTTKPGGTGLGLFIVKQIVEEHGGKIELKSEEGVGTAVRILLP